MDSNASGESTRQLLRALRRRWALVAGCAAAGAVAAGGVSAVQPHTYQASANLLFRDPGFDQTLFGSTLLAPSNDPTRQAATNLRLVRLGVVAGRTARAASRPARSLTRRDIESKVAVHAEGTSDVVGIDATDEDPQVAARIANTFAREFIRFRQEADKEKIGQAIAQIRDQLRAPGELPGTDKRTLEQRIEQLSVLASLQTGNAELVQPATVPTQPSGPRTKRNVAVGGVLGLLLGLLITILAERLDRRVRDPEQLESLSDLPLLAAVARSSSVSGAGHAGPTIPVEVAEDIHLLRARLRYFNVDRQVNSLIVTSAAAGEGKSTIAWLLSLTSATTSGTRVILVEADLRRPTLATNRGLRPVPGLSEVLSGGSSLEAAVQRVSYPSGQEGGERSIDVLSAGSPPPNPAELLESHRMAALLDNLRRDYDLVIIDTPPVLVVSDSHPLLARVDGVIVVARVGHSLKESYVRLRRELREVNAPVLGVVANGARSEGSSGYYGYAPYQALDSQDPAGVGQR